MIYLIIGSILAISFIVFKGHQRFKKSKENKIFDIKKTEYDEGSDEEEIFNLINTFRRYNSKPPLKIDLVTSGFAYYRNVEMINDGKLSHELSGDEFSKLMKLGADVVGENIAFGYGTAVAVVNSWVKSPGHKKNILNANFDWVGINVFKNKEGRKYFTALFAGDDEIQNQLK